MLVSYTWGGDGGSRPRRHDLANVRRFCTRLGGRWWVSGARWGKGAIVAYAKFYVKFRSQIARPHLRFITNEV